MNKLIATAALLSVFAAGAFAQSPAPFAPDRAAAEARAPGAMHHGKHHHKHRHHHHHHAHKHVAPR